MEDLVSSFSRASLGVIVKIGDQEFQVDKSLLTSKTSYFRAFFDFHKDSKCAEISLDICDVSTLKVILHGLIDSNYRIDESNVRYVLKASAYLQCYESEKACSAFISKNISLYNVFSLHNLANEVESSILKSTVDTFFKTLTGGFSISELADWSFKDVSMRLKSMKDNLQSFVLACAWAVYDLPNRGGSVLADLLKDVLFEFVQLPESIDGLQSELCVLKGIQTYFKYSRLSLTEKKLYWSNKKTTNLWRWPKLILICCFSGSKNDSILAYRDSFQKKWIHLTSKPFKFKGSLSSSNLVVHNDGTTVYFIGGEDDSIWSYNVLNGNWTHYSLKSEFRVRAGICSKGNFIYVFGGFSNERHLETVVKLDTEKQEWIPLSPMEYPRTGARLIEKDGKVYVFGGLGPMRQCVCSVETYDIATDSWKLLTELPEMITDFGIIEYENTILLIGGCNPVTSETTKGILSLDLNSLKWKIWKTKLNVPRQSCGVFSQGSMIYVIGGVNSSLDKLTSGEFIDMSIDNPKWEITDKLPKKISSALYPALNVRMPISLMQNYIHDSHSRVYF